MTHPRRKMVRYGQALYYRRGDHLTLSMPADVYGYGPETRVLSLYVPKLVMEDGEVVRDAVIPLRGSAS